MTNERTALQALVEAGEKVNRVACDPTDCTGAEAEAHHDAMAEWDLAMTEARRVLESEGKLAAADRQVDLLYESREMWKRRAEMPEMTDEKPALQRLVEAASSCLETCCADCCTDELPAALTEARRVLEMPEGEPKADRCAGCKFDHRHCQLCLDDIEAQKAPPEGEQAGVERNEPTWGDFEMAAKRTYLALRKSAEWQRRAEKAEARWEWLEKELRSSTGVTTTPNAIVGLMREIEGEKEEKR